MGQSLMDMCMVLILPIGAIILAITVHLLNKHTNKKELKPNKEVVAIYYKSTGRVFKIFKTWYSAAEWINNNVNENDYNIYNIKSVSGFKALKYKLLYKYES